MRTIKFLVCALVLAACSSGNKKLDLGGTCSLNSDCQDGLLCKFGACHKACVKSIDCATGERCVQVDGVAVCQLVAEQACKAGYVCAAPLACMPADNTCRNTCSPTVDCLGGQVCTAGYCVEKTETLANPDASVGPDVGTSSNSDTAGDRPLTTDASGAPDTANPAGAGDAAEGGTGRLFGVARKDQTTLSVFWVDLTTGRATPWFETSIPTDFFVAEMVQVRNSGHILVGGLTTVLDIDPVARTSKQILIKGLPQGWQVSGLTAVPQVGGSDDLIGTAGTAASYLELQLVRLSLDGEVLSISPDLGLGDRDQVEWDAKNSRLLAIDFNGSIPRIAAVADPFGRPLSTAVASPPSDADLWGAAVDPSSGIMYVLRNQGNLHQLIRIAGDQYIVIGDLGVTMDMADIEFIRQ